MKVIAVNCINRGVWWLSGLDFPIGRRTRLKNIINTTVSLWPLPLRFLHSVFRQINQLFMKHIFFVSNAQGISRTSERKATRQWKSSRNINRRLSKMWSSAGAEKSRKNIFSWSRFMVLRKKKFNEWVQIVERVRLPRCRSDAVLPNSSQQKIFLIVYWATLCQMDRLRFSIGVGAKIGWRHRPKRRAGCCDLSKARNNGNSSCDIALKTDFVLCRTWARPSERLIKIAAGAETQEQNCTV